MENKDCTGCYYAVMDDIRDTERCYCSNLEIHIFNPEPFYCSDWAPKEGQQSLGTINEGAE